jgi:hypothetical protein
MKKLCDEAATNISGTEVHRSSCTHLAILSRLAVS